VADSDQASDQLDAQTRPIGAQTVSASVCGLARTRLGAMPVELVGQRDAHGLGRRAIGKAGVTRLVIIVEHQGCHVSVQPPCLNRSKRPLQWPDLAEEQRDALRPL